LAPQHAGACLAALARPAVMTDAIAPAARIFLHPPARLQVQAVLNNHAARGLGPALLSLVRAAEIAMAEGLLSNVHLALGDISPSPCLDQTAQAGMAALCEGVMSFSYEHFGPDPGPAGGHNRLAARAGADFIMVQNADAVPSPRLILNLLKAFSAPGIGMVEAKQLPLEHPKDYDKITGETGWVDGTCFLMPLALFRSAGGFDSASFFMCCHDVDLSWSVRLAGYKLITQPAAVVFHDQRLSPAGKWRADDTMRLYAAEASLMLAYKWSRMDILSKILAAFRQSGDEHLVQAVHHFARRQDGGSLPAQLDPDHNIAYFVHGTYAPQRFALHLPAERAAGAGAKPMT
jgi:hypothetical protein